MSTRSSDNPSNTGRLERSRHTYDLLRLLLNTLLVAIVLSTLVLNLLQGIRIEKLATENHELGIQNRSQSALVAQILERQKLQDDQRQGTIRDAIEAIAIEHKRQLAMHDATIKQEVDALGDRLLNPKRAPRK